MQVRKKTKKKSKNVDLFKGKTRVNRNGQKRKETGKRPTQSTSVHK